MQTRMLAAVAGIHTVALWPALVPWWWPLVAALPVTAISVMSSTRHPVLRGGSVLVVCFLLGLTWHLLRADQLLRQRLPVALEGMDLAVTGVVVSLPERRVNGQRFHFRVETGDPGIVGRRVLLNHYDSQVRTATDAPTSRDATGIRAGQRCHWTIRLQQPHGFANPGTFDYEAWLFQQGLSARGYVRPGAANRCTVGESRRLLAWRSALRQRLLAATDGLAFQAVILALSLGDRSQLSDQQWALFTATGTNHLVVISGLHVALFAGLSALLTGRLWRCSTTLMLWLPAQQAAALAAILAAAGYSLMAGFALPAQRALVMVAVFMISRMLSLNGSALASLSLALLVVSLLDPMAATGAGLWLSFGAVTALLLVFTGTPRAGAGRQRISWRALLAPQLVVFVGLLVPLGVWLGQLSLIAPLANTVAIPLVSWLVVPLCLLASMVVLLYPPLGVALFQAVDHLFGWLYQVLDWLVAIPQQVPGMVTSWPIFPVSGLLLLAAITGSLLLLLPGGGRYRALALLLLLPFLQVPPVTDDGPLLTVHVLDVGQGLAVVLQTAGHTLVYDTGPRYVSGFDSGTAIVVPVLRHLGVGRVDTLVVSHGDNDHAGGAAGLLQAMAVDRLISGEPLPELPVAGDRCGRGQSWRWDGVEFSFLYPFNPTAAAGPGTAVSGNNSSCVLLVRADGFTLLLPGDIEGPVERLLLTTNAPPADLDLLVAAHHGSNTSSTGLFVRHTRPSLVIHSAGYRNQFGHPAARVRQRLAAIGSRQLMTADEGMISVVVSDAHQPPAVQRYRRFHRRYWHWSASGSNTDG